MPLFDRADLLLQGNPVVNSYITQLSLGKVADAGLLLEHATDWLYEQRDCENNYKAYRSELTTFFTGVSMLQVYLPPIWADGKWVVTWLIARRHRQN